MRKLSIILAISLLVSCSKDEVNNFEYYPETVQTDPEVKNVDIIVGTWVHDGGLLEIFSNNMDWYSINRDDYTKSFRGSWIKLSEDSYLVNGTDTYINVRVEGSRLTYTLNGETKSLIAY